MREQQEDWEERQSAYIRGRKLPEVIRSAETPEAIWWAMRTHVAHEERLGGLSFVEPENRYSRDAMVGIFADRAAECKMLLNPSLITALGLDRHKELGFAPESKPDLTPVQLKGLIDSLKEASKELWARWRIMGASRQHRGAGQDLETVTVKVFTSPSKVILEGDHFATVGKAKETLPGAKPFGDLLDEAMRVWDDIGEHKVLKKDADGNEIPKRDAEGKILRDKEGNIITEEDDLSIFDRAVYEDRVQAAVVDVTEKIVERKIPEENRQYDLYWEDAENAAYLSLQIARILNLDSKWAVSGLAEPIDSKIIEYLLHNPRDGVRHKVEFGFNASDLVKIQYFIARQVNEFGSEFGPRQTVMPAIVGRVPNLTMDFMRMAVVGGERPKTSEEIEIDKKKIEEEEKKAGKTHEEIEKSKEKTEKEKIEEYVNLYTLWKEMKVRFGDLPWDKEKWPEGAKHFEKRFGGKGWKVRGLQKDLIDIPLTLEQFHAVTTVFEMLTRKDLDKAFEDIQNGNYLFAQNKGFELTFLIMTRGCGLAKLEKKKKTMTKIRQLTKMNALIGIAVANTPDDWKNEREGFSKVTSRHTAHSRAIREGKAPRIHGVEVDLNLKIDNMIEAAENVGFLTSASPTDPFSEEQLKREKLLLAESLGSFGLLARFFKGKPTRRGFLPSETGWFDEEEIEAIKDSGLYAPYNQV